MVFTWLCQRTAAASGMLLSALCGYTCHPPCSHDLLTGQTPQDRRKELTKKVSKMGEDGKVAVRNVRKDALKRLDKHDFPKDARKAIEDAIQKITDKFVKSVDDLVKGKSDELMKV